MVVLILLMVGAVVFGWAGFGGASNFAIRVIGTDDVEFTGEYTLMAANGSSTSRRVSGSGLTVHTARAKDVSAVFQKQGEAGSLKVEIVRGQWVVA